MYVCCSYKQKEVWCKMAKGGVGGYAFMIGLIIAVLLGLIAGLMPTVIGSADAAIVLVLIILGLIVGLVNVKDEHINDFLVAVIAVAIIGVIPIQGISGMQSTLGTVLGSILQNIVVFAAPAALVLGLKQIWSLGYAIYKK